jgi:peptide/nickel transport system substrate-binding protein
MKRRLIVFAMLGLVSAGPYAFQGTAQAAVQAPSELRFCLRADPKTFDPLLVEDDNSETVRYLTGGVLIRIDRKTQQLNPELATSWNVDSQGRRITFHLRPNVKFSDGTPFSADDVAFTMKRLMDPETHSPTGDAFRSSDVAPRITVSSPLTVSILFGAPVAGMERLFDQVAIVSAKSPQKIAAVLGSYSVAEYKAGTEILLSRNPNYWKVDPNGTRLPYIDRIRLEIQQNRDIELVKFRRGEIDLINSVDADTFDELTRLMPHAGLDAGASLESEMMWFNQVASSPLPAYKQTWFRSTAFRRAVSEAINRADICKVVYRGHARPAEGPISPANRFWFNASLKPHPYDIASAKRRLEAEGFRLRGGALYDREGHAVEFSVITNAGNRSRERIASMMKQDLEAIGIRLNVVTLDFPSLIERITQTFNYESCLLGLTNLDLDPSAQMNVWLSSAANHQWNPNQKQPATAWEAEIDKLMRAQASDIRPEVRKRAFDRVQQIVSDEAPFLYLVTKNSLTAISPEIQNASPVVMTPQAFWNIDWLRKPPFLAGSR